MNIYFFEWTKKIRIKAGKFRSRKNIFFKALLVQIFRYSRYLPSASSSILEDDAVCLSHFTRDHAAFAVPKLGSDFFDLRRHPFHCIAVYHEAGAYILVPMDTFRFFVIFFVCIIFFFKKQFCAKQEVGGGGRPSHQGGPVPNRHDPPLRVHACQPGSQEKNNYKLFNLI